MWNASLHKPICRNSEAFGESVSSCAWGAVPAEVLPKHLGAGLADAPAQAWGCHPEGVVLQQLMAVLVLMVRRMQIKMDAGALWPVVPSGNRLAALQQSHRRCLTW